MLRPRRRWSCRRPRPSASRRRGSAGRLPDIALVSVHGRALDRIRPQLHPGARVLALTSDSEGPEALARLLAETGFGASRLTVLEALGGASERVRTTTAAGFDFADVAELNTVAIEVAASPGARIIAYTPGLADALFEHDGQITKREIRAVTLSALAPLKGEMLWDIGAARARSRSNGCSPIPRCAPSPSKRAPTAPRASGATPPLSACPVSKWSRVARRRRSQASPARRHLHRRRRERGRRARCRNRGAPSRRAARRQCGDACRPRPR